MHKLDQQGSLFIPLLLVIVLLLASVGFGVWAYMGREDYKNNVDAKIDAAVEVAEETLDKEKEAEFAEREKDPFKTYQGPVSFGTLRFSYPKSWSAYVEEGDSRSSKITGYFHPDFVPATDSDTSFAFRFEVDSRTYDVTLKSYESMVKAKRLTLSAYRAPLVNSELGSQLTGEIISGKQGVMVLLPVRDKTIKVWTEGDSFRGDFEKVLSQLTFVP